MKWLSQKTVRQFQSQKKQLHPLAPNWVVFPLKPDESNEEKDLWK